MATCGWARAARTCATSCGRTPPWPARSRPPFARRRPARAARRWRRPPRCGPVAASRSRSQPPPDAFDAAIRLLGVRPHGEVELRRKLARRGCPPEQVDEALERARRLGYLDDRAFARALGAYRAGGRGAAVLA